MVSFLQLGIALTAGGYVVGRKELPKVSRAAGKLTGRALGSLLRAKKEMFDATSDSKLVKMQRELQKGLDELNDIRREFSSIGSIKRPYQPSSATNASAAPQSKESTNTQLRTSLAMASATAQQALGSDFQNNDPARLAVAEVQLSTRENTFHTRIEALEGGADYVSATIVDSLLIKPIAVSPATVRQPKE